MAYITGFRSVVDATNRALYVSVSCVWMADGVGVSF